MIHRFFMLPLLRRLRTAAAYVLPALALSLAVPAGAQVVISQVYGAGGNSGAAYNYDWVELHNKGTAAVNLSSYSLQYASSTGSGWSSNLLPLKNSIPAGGYYLIRLGSNSTSIGSVLPVSPDVDSGTNLSFFGISGTTGKLALVSNANALSGACPTGGAIVDFVGYGNTAGNTANCSETAPAPTLPNTTSGLVRGSTGNSCVDTGNNSTDFNLLAYPLPRNSSSPAQPCVPQHCGAGIALTTSPVALWQQLSLPCGAGAGATTVGTVIGGGTTGKLDSAKYDTGWSLWQRNAANSGNVQMSLTDTIAVGSGHWIKSLDAPVGGTLIIDNLKAIPTLLTTGLTGCNPASAQGCIVLRVPSATAGTRMIANPLPYDIDWSKVAVRVGGAGGTVYTPSTANTANILSNNIWIYNGTSYRTWSDTTPNIGNLQYFKSFFVKVLPTGVGKTIDLLIPALASTVTVTAARPAALARNEGAAQLATIDLPVDPTTRVSRAWVVDLDVQNVDTGWWATAKLGQWPGANAGRDAGDLAALAPFAQPFLTVVFPRPEWKVDPGDYSTDLRPADGLASSWDFEVRAEPLGSKVVLRWNAPAAALAKSRLIDRDTGLVLYPTDPNYADGYPLTLDTPVRRLTWQYMGN